MTRVLRYAGVANDPLPQNPRHAFAARYALSIYASDAVYSFIPKNGCTTMRYSLALANGAIEDESQFNWVHANNDTFRASLRDVARARYAFTILRDPFLRLASGFLDKLVEQTPVAASLHRLTNYAGSPHDLTFRGFVMQLATHLRADEHWRPQADFLVYKNYDDVFCLEDFGAAAATLKAKIGFDVRDARGLAKHGADRFAPVQTESAADLAAFDLLALKRSGRIPRPRDFYDAELIAQVGELYAEDVRLYREACGREPGFG